MCLIICYCYSLGSKAIIVLGSGTFAHKLVFLGRLLIQFITFGRWITILLAIILQFKVIITALILFSWLPTCTMRSTFNSFSLICYANISFGRWLKCIIIHDICSAYILTASICSIGSTCNFHKIPPWMVHTSVCIRCTSFVTCSSPTIINWSLVIIFKVRALIWSFPFRSSWSNIYFNSLSLVLPSSAVDCSTSGRRSRLITFLNWSSGETDECLLLLWTHILIISFS